MKKEDLLNVIGDIDDDLITEANIKPKKSRIIPFIKIAAPVAAALLLIGILIPIMSGNVKNAMDNSPAEGVQNVAPDKNSTSKEPSRNDVNSMEGHYTPKDEIETNSSESGANDEWDAPYEKDEFGDLVYGQSWTEYKSEGNSDELKKHVTDFTSKIMSPMFDEWDKTGNLVYSPLSLYMALAFSGELAEGEKAQDLYSLLGVSSDEELKEMLSVTYGSVIASEGRNQFLSDMSMWLDGYDLSSGAAGKITAAADAFHASVFNTKLGNKETGIYINKWMRNVSRGLGRKYDYVGLGEGNALLVTSSVYDKTWKARMGRNIDSNDTFRTLDGRSVESSSLTTFDIMKTTTTEHANAVALEYSDGSYMILVRPVTDEYIEAVIDEDMHEIIDNFQNEKNIITRLSQVRIPFVNNSCSVDNADKVLESLGVKSIFSEKSYSYIDESMKVGNLVLNSTIMFGEEGKNDWYTGDNEHPDRNGLFMMSSTYAYVIMSSDNVPLFVGVIADPLAQ